MSTTNYDSRTADKFVVRLPDGLRADIEAAANADDRSMNSVFVKAVRQYLDGQSRQQILLDVLASTVATPFRGIVPGRFDTRVPAALADSMHIDDRVKMAANAKRYEWLRNVAATTGSGHTPMVKVAGGPGRWRTGEDLDQSIDQAMRAWPGQQDEEQHPCID